MTRRLEHPTSPAAHYATMQKAPELLSISRTRIYDLVRDGTLRAVKVRGRTLLDMDHARAWLASLPAISEAA